MGWLQVFIAVVSSILLYDAGHPVLLTIALMVLAGCMWSWGVMHNFAIEEAKKRPGFTGDFYDIREAEVDAVPNWIASLNMIFAGMAVALLVTALIITF